MRIHHRWIKIESIIQMSQFQNVPFCPISASPMSGIYAALRQAQIVILEILQCIPVVIIFAFLDLGENISFSDSLLEKTQVMQHF